MKGKGTKVLVTGGSGYLGSILCEVLLKKGHTVTAIDNLLYRQQSLFHIASNPRFNFVFGDVRDEKLMKDLIKKTDVLIPLAAIVGAPACERNPQLATSVNLEAIRLLNRLRSKNQLVIYPTTNSGYGTKSGDTYCTEDTPLEPISLYGRTKSDAERHLLGTPNVITLRLATVFGMSPRMRLDLLVNDFTYKAFTDGHIVIFEKDFKRNYVHIRDVADCFVYCMEHPKKMIGHPYNVGSDEENLSKEELALKIKKIIPNFYIHFSEVGSDPDKRNYIVSNKRLTNAGFRAKRTIEDGIQELIKGYQMLKHLPHKNI
jgi:nucleoside-diphosphate-sugar epimerase